MIYFRNIYNTFILILILLSFLACESEVADSSKYEIEKTFTVGAAPIQLDVKIDRKEINISDTLLYILDIVQKDRCKAERPDTLKIDFGGFELLNVTQNTRVNEEGFTVLENRYKLAPFLSGDYKINPITVEYILETSSANDVSSTQIEPNKIQTEPIDIKVIPLSESDSNLTQLRPIIDPLELRTEALDWYVYVGSILILLLLGGIGYLIYKKKISIKETLKKFKSAHELAYEELESLREMNLLEEGKIKEFYYHITEIIRRYIERRFTINAPDMTTEEFLYLVSSNITNPIPQREVLSDFMMHCDYVKYAQYLPVADEIQKTIDTTIFFIEQTKQTNVEAKSGV